MLNNKSEDFTSEMKKLMKALKEIVHFIAKMRRLKEK